MLSQTSLLGSQPANPPSFGIGAIPAGGVTNPPITAANNPPLHLPDLDLSDLDASSLEATASDTDEINTLIQSDSQLQEDATVLQSPAGERLGMSPGETQSELDFILEQLGLDLTTSTSLDADLETRLDFDQMPQDDVNELYESLFGVSGSTVTEDQSSTGGLPVAAGEPTTVPLTEDTASALNKSDVSTTDVSTTDISTTDISTTDAAQESQHNPPEGLPDPSAPPTTDSLPTDQPESADTIAALTDLRWDTDLSKDQSAPDPNKAEDQTNRADLNTSSIPQSGASADPTGTEDSYTPASPAENLLASEDPEAESMHDILLNLETLEQLNEDLSNLEKPNVELPATSVQPPATAKTIALRTSPSEAQPLPSSPVVSAEVSGPAVDQTIPASSSTPLDLTPSPDQTPSETEKKN